MTTINNILFSDHNSNLNMKNNNLNPNIEGIEYGFSIYNNCFSSRLLKVLKPVFAPFLFFMFLFGGICFGQVQLIAGPSDATTAPPSSASAVGTVLAVGGTVSVKAGTSGTPPSDVVYQWYKLDSTGVKHLVQSGNSNTFQETATAPGYYTYQLVMSNSNQCTSQISDPFQVYVLPTLSPSIAVSNGTICANGSSTATLSANAGNSRYAYLYQWSLNGADISGATSATYSATATSTGSSSYAVRVAYALSPNLTGSASQTINVVAVPSKPAISAGQ